MAIIDPPGEKLLPGCSSDRWGYQIHTFSDQCIQHINSHYLEVLSYGANQKIIHKAVEDDHSCALALALSAVHSYKSNTDDALMQLAKAKSYLIDATPYERSVIAAAEALIEGQWEAAISAYSKVLDEFPKDLVSLKRAQVLCFYRGKSDESLRLAQKVLPANKDSPYIYGMLAFSLLETRRFDEAEAAAKTALDIERTDQWAQHALCHVYQYRCLFHDAIIFMERNKLSWNNCCSFMYSHNWWHLALLYMDWGCSYALNKVVEIFDIHIWPARCRDLGGSVQVSLNALGLLLRLELRGYGDCIRTHIYEVAEHLCDPILWHHEWLLDVLSVWALAYVGQLSTSEQLLKQIQERVHSLGPNEQGNLQVFVKLAESMYEYGKGNPEEAFNVLGASFDTLQLKIIGASDEQLDVFEEMMCISALRSNQFQQDASSTRRGFFVREEALVLSGRRDREMNVEENPDDGDTIGPDSDQDFEPHADQQQLPRRPWACLVAIERSNPDIELWEDDTIVGRGDANGNKGVSKLHCRIFKNSSGKIFVNNFSKNGILINGSRLKNEDSRSLKNGDEISLGVLPGLPQYIVHIRDNRQNVLKNGTVNGRRTNELSKFKDDLKCCICLSLLHDVVTVAPCLHNFCNGCFSACYKNNRTPRFQCPQCRQPIVFVKRNHTLCNIIQGYLEEYPALKRPAEEIRHLDQISIVGSNFVKVGTYDDGSASDDDRYQYCPQCLRSNVATDGAFRCGVGTHHIECSTCNMLMPDRSDIDVPQKCAGCCRAFCGLYWNSQSIIRSSDSSCMMRKMDEQIIIDFPMRAFQGNAFEQDVTKRYLEEYGISIRDIVQADFGKMCMGVIGKPESLDGLFTTESYFCEHCVEIIIAHLLYEFRLSIPRNELPPDVAGRENCWYGRLCRTQRHNTLHTQKYNHACEPRPRHGH